MTDFPPGITGLSLNFRIRATNLSGFSVTSPSQATIIADVPLKPASPIIVQSLTSATQITIQLTTPENGGSTLLGYDVEMDDVLGGGFSSISTTLLAVTRASVTSTSHAVKKGLTYRFRYRAKNVIGFSNYSDTVSFMAASVPDAP